MSLGAQGPTGSQGRPRFLHLAAKQVEPRAWTRPFVERLRELGDLDLVEGGDELADDEAAELIRGYDVLIPSWGARMTPAQLAQSPGRLRYVCHLTGGMRPYVPVELVVSSIPVTNWGDAQARAVAEGAVLLLLAGLKGLRHRLETIAAGGWRPADTFRSGMLYDLPLGVYGCGLIGRVFIDMVRPFAPRLRVYDPYARRAQGGEGSAATPGRVEAYEWVDSLDEVFDGTKAVAIHAGWTQETEGSVTARHLALLPDGGILVNTARGAIIDQEALFAELERGRLRAGLDVLAPPETLPAQHPARRWPNLVLTAHSLSQPYPKDYDSDAAFEPMHHICLDNLRRFLAGEPLRFPMDRERYELST